MDTASNGSKGDTARLGPDANSSVAAPQVDAKPKKPKAIVERDAKILAARADYFTPGNIVQGYSGFDEVLAYEATEGGGFKVTVTKGAMLGFDFEVSAARSPGGSHYAELAILDAKGRTVGTAQFRDTQGMSTYTTQALSRAIDEATYSLNPGSFEDRAKRARDRAERAESELPDIRPKAYAPFAHADELKAKRERLEEGIRALAADKWAPGPVDQPAGTAPTDDAAFNRIDEPAGGARYCS